MIIFTILFLVFLEALLSLDNALVLAVMVGALPKDQQKRALSYGIWGAFLFRFVALFFLQYLMKMYWIKLVGGVYLLYLVWGHFFKEEHAKDIKPSQFSFWRVVLSVELMDIAFSIDSILAAVSLSSNYFVVFVGGVLGIICMRFAATLLIPLMSKFKRLADTSYYLIALIGTKLILEGMHISHLDFHSYTNPAGYVFWISMLLVLARGFRK